MSDFGYTGNIKKCPAGHIFVNDVTVDSALEEIEELAAMRSPGANIVTPNLQHVVLAKENPVFREAMNRANLSICDGVGVQLLAGLSGNRVNRIPGSRFIWRLIESAPRYGWKVLLLGGAPGVAESAKERFIDLCGSDWWQCDTWAPDLKRGTSDWHTAVDKLYEQEYDLCILALGAPKQELFADACVQAGCNTVFVGLGATLDFVAGKKKLAPEWISKAGLETPYRLVQEPKRLWRRYLLEYPKAAPLFLDAMLSLVQ